jgi:hypothetical protein
VNDALTGIDDRQPPVEIVARDKGIVRYVDIAQLGAFADPVAGQRVDVARRQVDEDGLRADRGQGALVALRNRGRAGHPVRRERQLAQVALVDPMHPERAVGGDHGIAEPPARDRDRLLAAEPHHPAGLLVHGERRTGRLETDRLLVHRHLDRVIRDREVRLAELVDPRPRQDVPVLVRLDHLRARGA